MILLIDKPAGITSFDVIRSLRRELGIKKIGHAGTLDPLATGLMILATGSDTKKLTQFLKLDKEYEVTAEFGKVSDTYDADGKIEIISGSSSNIRREELNKLLKDFIGEIEQTPPEFSAVKIKGKPAYKYARRGEAVVLPKRKVRIAAIEMISFSPPFAEFRIACGSGTYIRSLIHELGQRIGTGALIKSLRRTKIGPYSVEKARPL